MGAADWSPAGRRWPPLAAEWPKQAPYTVGPYLIELVQLLESQLKRRHRNSVPLYVGLRRRLACGFTIGQLRRARRFGAANAITAWAACAYTGRLVATIWPRRPVVTGSSIVRLQAVQVGQQLHCHTSAGLVARRCCYYWTAMLMTVVGLGRGFSALPTVQQRIKHSVIQSNLK